MLRLLQPRRMETPRPASGQWCLSFLVSRSFATDRALNSAFRTRNMRQHYRCLPFLLCAAGYSFVHGPATHMVRPHPAFWRLVHGVMVCYLLFIVYLLFQNVDDARQFLKVKSNRVPQPIVALGKDNAEQEIYLDRKSAHCQKVEEMQLGSRSRASSSSSTCSICILSLALTCQSEHMAPTARSRFQAAASIGVSSEAPFLMSL